jgi:hypothetical protein
MLPIPRDCPFLIALSVFSYVYVFNRLMNVPIKKTQLYIQLHSDVHLAFLPKWKSALFWPIVWNHSENYFHNFVKDFIEFYRPKQFY